MCAICLLTRRLLQSNAVVKPPCQRYFHCLAALVKLKYWCRCYIRSDLATFFYVSTGITTVIIMCRDVLYIIFLMPILFFYLTRQPNEGSSFINSLWFPVLPSPTVFHRIYPFPVLPLHVRLHLQQLGPVLCIVRRLLQRLDFPSNSVYWCESCHVGGT